MWEGYFEGIRTDRPLKVWTISTATDNSQYLLFLIGKSDHDPVGTLPEIFGNIVKEKRGEVK